MAINHRDASIFDRSPSPQLQQQHKSKRDVRRDRIMDKLKLMVDGFAANQDQHYRAQLQGVQVDMTLVLRADPYGSDEPLGESHEEIRELVEQVMQPDAQGQGGITLASDEDVQTDFWATAGKRYGEFARDVNDSIEQRDADLTLLHVSRRCNDTNGVWVLTHGCRITTMPHYRSSIDYTSNAFARPKRSTTSSRTRSGND